MKASLREIPRLTAEESLLMAQRVAAGTGSFADKSTARRVFETWQRQAGVLPKATRATPEALAALGIGVTRVTKRR